MSSVAIDSHDRVVVLPWQLLDEHPLTSRAAPSRVVLYDDPLVVGGDAQFDPGWHAATLAWRRAAIDAWRSRHPGIVHLRRDDAGIDGEPAWAIRDALDSELAEAHGVRVHVLDPVDDWALRRLDDAVSAAGSTLVVHDTPQLLLTRAQAQDMIGSAAHPRMSSFYARQRRHLGVLVDEQGQPVGGRWSFDADNRKRLPRSVADQLDPWPWPADAPAARAWAARQAADAPGSCTIAFPTTAQDARRWLDRFVDERLELFGPYEDALHKGSSLIFHAAITPMLNHGLLTAREVLDAVVAGAHERPAVPLSSLEGFVRQLIGWREFMRAVYQQHGTRLRTGNRWQHTRSLPAGLLDATTGIDPIDDVMRRVGELGWCHHIERLMVLGGYLFLTETHPDEVYAFFMRMFTDALDWVMVPNVYGMSQDAAGGLVTTKPYFSGSAYIRRMGWPVGAWCELWDSLYWRFVMHHADELRRNPRWSMAVRNADKLDSATRSGHVARAEAHIESCR